MKSTRSVHFLALSVVVALTLGACQGQKAELTGTSVLVADSDDGPVESTPTTLDQADETTTSILRGQSVDSYRVVGRESGEDGETLYIVIPPGAYTDVDLENFILDLYESETATHGVEVFDDDAAVDAFLKDAADRTEAEQELVDERHFVSLVDGALIRFQGPFSSSGEYPIGS